MTNPNNQSQLSKDRELLEQFKSHKIRYSFNQFNMDEVVAAQDRISRAEERERAAEIVREEMDELISVDEPRTARLLNLLREQILSDSQPTKPETALGFPIVIDKTLKPGEWRLGYSQEESRPTYIISDNQPTNE